VKGFDALFCEWGEFGRVAGCGEDVVACAVEGDGEGCTHSAWGAACD